MKKLMLLLLFSTTTIFGQTFQAALDAELGVNKIGDINSTALKLWLDGTDPLGTGTPPLDGAAISTWFDKSGHNNNATQITTSKQPSYSSAGYVNFDEDYLSFLVGQNNIELISSANIYIVMESTNSDGNSYAIYGFSPNNSISNTRSSRQLYINSLDKLFAVFRTLHTVTGTSTIPANETVLISPKVTKTSATHGTYEMFLNNGSEGARNTSFMQDPQLATSTFWLGHGYANYDLKAKVKEFIFFDSALSVNDDIQIKYYLAKKWNMTNFDSDGDGVIDGSDVYPLDSSSWEVDLVTKNGEITNAGIGNAVSKNGAIGRSSTLDANGKITIIPTYCSGATTVVDVTSVTGAVWMDRNLGAIQVATSSADSDAYGDLYQWGRFSDGHQCRTSSTTTTLATNSTPGHGDFIGTNWNWLSPPDNTLWQGVNGTNNPCPSGYRVPTEIELEAERSVFSTSDAAGAFASVLKLPAAGRHHNNGNLYGVGSWGGYWSSNSGRFLTINSTAGMTNYNQGQGLSVRCIKD